MTPAVTQYTLSVAAVIVAPAGTVTFRNLAAHQVEKPDCSLRAVLVAVRFIAPVLSACCPSSVDADT